MGTGRGRKEKEELEAGEKGQLVGQQQWKQRLVMPGYRMQQCEEAIAARVGLEERQN